MNTSVRCIAALAASSMVLSIAAAGELFAYPPVARSPAQQGQDAYECHQWAVEQSKFDPVRMAAQLPAQSGQTVPQPASDASTSGKSAGAGQAVLGGAAQGALIGAVSDGDIEKSATAGAAGGVLRTRMAERKAAAERAAAQLQAEQRARQQQEMQAAQAQAKQKSYDRARATCLKARGYTVSEG